MNSDEDKLVLADKRATLEAHRLVGPEAKYSKIGRERRAKLREEIVDLAIWMYRLGRDDSK